MTQRTIGFHIITVEDARATTSFGFLISRGERASGALAKARLVQRAVDLFQLVRALKEF
jgi:hypothetical protein